MAQVTRITSRNAGSIRVGKAISKPRWKLDDMIAKNDALSKEDATYTNNPLYKVIDGYFKVNPIYEDPILQQFGTLDLSDMSPMEKYIQYEAVVAKSNGLVADDLNFTSGDSKVYPALRKSLFFQFGAFLPELKKKALDAGGRGGAMIAAQVEAEIQASKGFMLKNLLKWGLNYQVLTSEVDYDPDWKGFIYPQGATGTASNPETVAGTPQTATAIAQNFTGTGKSKDFISLTFGASQEVFRAERDSTTGEQMLHANLDSNNFLHLMHPHNKRLLNEVHPYNGVQDDQSITYMQQIQNLEGNHTVLGSYDVDATVDHTEDGANIVVSLLNPNENFKWAYQVPFIEEGWREAWMGRQFGYIKRAYMKVMPWIRPYYIGGTWVKAMDHWSYVHFNDA